MMQDDGYASTSQIGDLGERIARDNLIQRGFAVLEEKYRCRSGEADLVVRDPTGTTVFVEVKLRQVSSLGAAWPEEAVDRAKRERYRAIARCYVADHPGVRGVRFDVIGISVMGRTARLRHISNAFDMEES